MKVNLNLLILASFLLSSCLAKNSSETASSKPTEEILGDNPRYLKSQFYLADGSGNKITKTQAATMTTVLICEVQSGFCQSICVNQIYNDIHRYNLLWSGRRPNGTCSVWLQGHNHEAGLPEYQRFDGTYQYFPNSVLGQCVGIDLSNPAAQGFYSFRETAAPSGEASPDPWGRRLYATLEFEDLSKNPSGRDFIRTYQPVQDSNTVYMFSYFIGNVETTLQAVPGYDCARADQITSSVISNLR